MAIPEKHKWRYVFHFTDIRNLDSIIKHSGLLCPNAKKKIKHINISNKDIQKRRAEMDVTVGSGGKVHDYVPFYFSSMNPMLLSLLNQKNVDQNLLIYFCLKIDILESDNVVFTDSSANRKDPPNFYEDANMLDQLNWEIIDSKKWSIQPNEAKIKKMAEVLVHQKVDLSQIDGIVVYNDGIKKCVEKIFKDNNITPPPIMYDRAPRIQNYKFYYTKFYINGKERDTLVTGPHTLEYLYKRIVKKIISKRANLDSFTYQTIDELLKAVDESFSILPELDAIDNLMQNYYPHNDTVGEHTRRVVENMKELKYYQEAPINIKNILLIAAYLHDIGKGPMDKWKNNIMERAYPDHPADAIPMLLRILSKEIAEISEDDIRRITLLVVYHDIVGDCMEKGRDISQIVKVIANEEDLEMLFSIAIADTKAINFLWAENIVAKKQEFCETVISLKNQNNG